MQYLLVFLEGILTFISPCVLPLLPVYIMYLAGGKGKSTKALIVNTLGFILSFTLIYCLLGAAATAAGIFLMKNRLIIQKISGVLMILLGLNYMGIINLRFINKAKSVNFGPKELNFFKSFIFGGVFSISITPCVSTFLASALLLSSSSATVLEGVLLLFLFSMGLAVPFLFTALLLNKLMSVFAFIKKNYKAVNIISGSVLIIMGIMLVFNLFGFYLGLF